MNRTPIVLSLFGLVLFLFGVYMMLRVVMAPISGGTMSDDPASQAHLDELRQDAGPRVFGTYVVMAASGFAVFAAGLAMLFGRNRLG